MSEEDRVDIAVIGGGIQGAAVARAAAAAGYRCRLLEQYAEPAQGSSSRSSKLIHGGLRYLETGQWRLVRECLRERAILLREYPELVRMVPFLIPVYEDTRRAPLTLRTGLALYRLLGGGPFRTLAKREWHALDGLKTNGLRAVLQYQDAQTDDAALTRAVLAEAQRLGARTLYGTRIVSGLRQAHGYRLDYVQDGIHRQLDAGFVINAAGPWVNRVLECFQPSLAGIPVDLVAGTHIEVPGHLERGIYYLESPADGRAVFVMPWRDRILMGTTERLYQGDPADIAPTEAEIRYLLDIHNHYFTRTLARGDVLNAFAGLRVLPASGDNPFTRRRDTLLHPDDPRAPHLLSVYGGKLTAHRATAEAVMKRLAM